MGDDGSIGFDGKIKEKDVTLAISKLLQKQLEAIPGYQVVMVRDSDYYVQLRRGRKSQEIIVQICLSQYTQIGIGVSEQTALQFTPSRAQEQIEKTRAE